MQVQPAMPVMLDVLSGSSSTFRVKASDHEVQAPPATTENSTDSQQAFQELSKALEPFDISLKFSKDDETGTIVVQLIDVKSGEAIRQIPSPARLHVAATLCKLQGQILNCKA